MSLKQLLGMSITADTAYNLASKKPKFILDYYIEKERLANKVLYRKVQVPTSKKLSVFISLQGVSTIRAASLTPSVALAKH